MQVGIVNDLSGSFLSQRCYSCLYVFVVELCLFCIGLIKGGLENE